MDKLSELSKPVAWTDAEELRDLSKHRCAYMFIIAPENPYHDPRRQQMLYSQEYVSALLAELEFEKQNNAGVAGMAEDYETKLEAKDKRIAELERILDGVTPVMIAGGWTAKGISDYAKSLETKLATPVRLPDSRQCVSGDRYQWSDGVHNYRKDAIATLREQGFNCVEDL